MTLRHWQIAQNFDRLAKIVLLALALVGFRNSALAQSGAPGEGVDNGNYNYQGSFEFGYRFVNTNGSQAVYDTFINQQEGPRLLEQTLSMRSLNHEAIIFDNLFLSSFGWGGDAENATRLRISKNKWYNFNASFRRDQNVWDYNLLANPLNPPNPFINIANSPHEMLTTRRMYDYNLTLFPQSAIRFRLGYTRNNMEGPAFSSIHQGTDAILFQNTRTLLNGYQAGVDIRVAPRTNISYDQFLQYYKGDSSWTDGNFGFQLANGSPVDAGMIYNAAANQPCGNAPSPIFDTSTTPATLKASCNGKLGYSRSSPIRTSYPTEQLTLQSRYFRKLDVSARGSYSSADTKTDDFSEVFLGLITRTGQRVFDGTGAARAKRVAANADFGVTFFVTDKFRVVDSFRFSNFRIPGVSSATTLSFFNGTLPASMLNPVAIFDPAVCPANPAACPQHGNTATTEICTPVFSRFLGQDSKYNTFQLEYDFSRHVGARLGYRYGRRTIPVRFTTIANETFFPSNPNRGDCTGLPLNADGTCSFTGEVDSEDDLIEVTEHSALFGLWAHPSDALRVNFDLELFSADNAPTRTTPRNLQRYKTRINYKPRSWINASGTINILESRNNVTDILHREHDRNYGFAVGLNPNQRFRVDFGYNYDDIFSTTNICYVIGATVPAGSTLCNARTPFLSGISLYVNKINFGYANFTFRPIKRVTTSLGYSLTSSSGDNTILSPVPNTLGPLGINFHKPFALIDFELARGFSWRTAWNYYDYNEKSSPGFLPPRDFQSNSATLSVRYAF